MVSADLPTISFNIPKKRTRTRIGGSTLSVSERCTRRSPRCAKNNPGGRAHPGFRQLEAAALTARLHRFGKSRRRRLGSAADCWSCTGWLAVGPLHRNNRQSDEKRQNHELRDQEWRLLLRRSQRFQGRHLFEK